MTQVIRPLIWEAGTPERLLPRLRVPLLIADFGPLLAVLPDDHEPVRIGPPGSESPFAEILRDRRELPDGSRLLAMLVAL